MRFRYYTLGATPAWYWENKPVDFSRHRGLATCVGCRTLMFAKGEIKWCSCCCRPMCETCAGADGNCWCLECRSEEN